MEPTPFETLLIERLDRLESKVDKVRTEDLPSMKTDVAVLIAKHKFQSKIYSAIGSFAAVVIGAAMPHR